MAYHAYVETGGYSAVGLMPLADGLIVGTPFHAPGPRAARAGAALALIRELAPPPPCTRRSPLTAQPVIVLNERAQLGVIAALSYEQAVSGPPHEPSPVRRRLRRMGREASGVAAGRSKNERPDGGRGRAA